MKCLNRSLGHHEPEHYSEYYSNVCKNTTVNTITLSYFFMCGVGTLEHSEGRNVVQLVCSVTVNDKLI